MKYFTHFILTPKCYLKNNLNNLAIISPFIQVKVYKNVHDNLRFEALEYLEALQHGNSRSKASCRKLRNQLLSSVSR